MLKKIGELLIDKRLTDYRTVSESIGPACEQGMRIGDYLIAEKGIDESDIYRTLAEQFSLPFLNDIEEKVDRTLLRDLRLEIFREGRCLPLSAGGEKLDVVCADPLDLDIIADIGLSEGVSVEFCLTTPSEMRRVGGLLFKEDSLFLESAGKISREYEKSLNREDGVLSIEEIKKRTESEPVVKMVSLLFNEAISHRASDIHLEPAEEIAHVRFRVDGMLQKHSDLSKGMYLPVTSRIKILANLDIAEKRVPQDGRIRYEFMGNQYDFRVSTLPTHWGEKTVIRILKHDLSLLDLENVGIAEKEVGLLKELIEKPQGIIFVTGPTGSGKSSTLFACLNRIRGKAINITTIENPIEYKLEGINQVQINEKAGVTFAATLRSILRQDPDVILIGEIRDRETAEIAMQASQTGHLVFSTLHTNDAVSAVTRLKDLGVPSYLISSSLLAIIAQRLVRKLCPACLRRTEYSEDLKKRWKAVLGDTRLPSGWESEGCAECGKTGFAGRTGIFELIPVSEEIRGMIAENVAEAKLKRYLRSQGIKSMIENGVEKIEEGITTPQELLRVVMVDDII